MLSDLSPESAIRSANWDGFRPPYLFAKSSTPNDTILKKIETVKHNKLVVNCNHK